MRGQRADILAQHDVRQFLARLNIVEVHGFGLGAFAGYCVPRAKGMQAMKAIEIENPGPDYRLVLGEMTPAKTGSRRSPDQGRGRGLNHADLLQARGLYPPPPGAPDTLGMEVSGIIVELGDSVTGWNIGDLVCALLVGRRLCRICAGRFRLPVAGARMRVDLVDAAACPKRLSRPGPISWIRARLQPGETLLVHGGTSGIGSLAIQMFAARGHRRFHHRRQRREMRGLQGFRRGARNQLHDARISSPR